MEPITGLFIFALLFAIVVGTYAIIDIFKVAGKELTRLQKKFITGIVGIILCLVWYFLKINQHIDILILTFFAAVGFYDIIIKTVIKDIGGDNGTKSDTGSC